MSRPTQPNGGGPSDASIERRDFVSPDGRHLRIYGQLRGRPGALPTIELSALHQRYDRLTDTWVAISPARNVRPHSSALLAGSAADAPPAFGPGPSAEAADASLSEPERAVCALCPGGPEVPFGYDAAVFDNRFPTFVAHPPPPPLVSGVEPVLLASSVGRCEVVLYTERHEGSIATLTPLELARVVAVWRDRTGELWSDPGLRFVMAFENRGEAVGATISHPHGQIYAFDRLPPFIAGRLEALGRHRTARDACLSCAVVKQDDASERLVEGNESFVIAVPFAPHWPYEVHVRARRHGLRRLTDLAPAEQRDLAAAIRGVVHRYDALFGFELPYMMAVLEAPAEAPDWHLAVEFLPPHRSERLTKVRASVETATGLFINDTLPEASAARLAAIAVPAREEAEPMTVSVVERIEIGG